MMRLLVCFLTAACSALAFIPAAQACDTIKTATLKSTCVVMEREGQNGVWFDLATADELRKSKLDVPELQLQISSYEQMALAREFQVSTYLKVIKLKDNALKVAEDNMAVFAKQARTAREDAHAAMDELDAWYRSPSLWAGIGAAVVTGIVVALEVR